MATVQCAESKKEPGIWQIEQAQIVQLGKSEGAGKETCS